MSCSEPRRRPRSATSIAAHPLYVAIAELSTLRKEHAALRRGKQIVRNYAEKPGLFAVSRIDPQTGREILIAFNTSTEPLQANVEVDARTRAFRSLKGHCADRPSSAGQLQSDVGALELRGVRGAGCRHEPHAEARVVVLADLEHVFRISGDPVRLRAPERQCEPDFPDAGRGPGPDSDAVGGGAADRAHRSAHRRLLLRSHLDPPRSPPTVFFFGAVAASLALLFMPNSPTLWIAAGLLWLLDASINVSMEPFRAYVGDQLPPPTTARRLRDAEFLHRCELGDRELAAVDSDEAGRREHRWSRARFRTP